MLGIYCKNHHKPHNLRPPPVLSAWHFPSDLDPCCWSYHIISYHISYITFDISYIYIYIICHKTDIIYHIYIYVSYNIYIYIIWCLLFFLLLLFIIISYLISKIIPWTSSPCAPGPHGDHLRLGELRGLRGGHGAAVQPRGVSGVNGSVPRFSPGNVVNTWWNSWFTQKNCDVP